jgi:hypothetical protein
MLEKLTRRDRVALTVAAAAGAVFLLVEFGLLPLYDSLRASSAGIEEKEVTLRRYQRLLAAGATLPATRAAAEQRLRDAESGLLESPSESLANAEWQRLVRELAHQKGLELASSEVLRAEKLSPDYALVTGRVALSCRLDQLVDLLVALATSPKLLAATNLRAMPLGSDREKRLQVEITIGAAMRAVKQGTGDRGQATGNRQ